MTYTNVCIYIYIYKYIKKEKYVKLECEKKIIWGVLFDLVLTLTTVKLATERA